jgi:hypothetical protein
MKTMQLCAKCEDELKGLMGLTVLRLLPEKAHCDTCAKKGFLTVCEVKG